MTSETTWRSIATQLAAIARLYPCTCMKKGQPWPALPESHVDKTCRRCKAIKSFEDAEKAYT